MEQASEMLTALTARHPGLFDRLEEIVTERAAFDLFRRLSDNYSPTLTVSRVQGALVERMVQEGAGTRSPLRVERNLRGSGSVGVRVGDGIPRLWLSAHLDICSYLTGAWNGQGYDLTPFCMHRASPGRRAAVALAPPAGEGALERLAEGVMVTDEAGRVVFESERRDLPRWTRVVHHLPATWDEESGEIRGFIDNQGGSAALLLAARALSHFDATVQVVLNDEEEGPVDRGNQGFSRAMRRLLHRTPLDALPDMAIVTDSHQQEKAMARGEPGAFGQGATFSGASSATRGAVTPPHLLAFTRDLAAALDDHGIALRENGEYVSRSDDVSLLAVTPNIQIIGFPGAYAHFEKPPIAHVRDVVMLARTLAVYVLVAQEPAWQAVYLNG